ncbi:LOW QUALITY PROTEIN: senescence-induced receptor-like serine/threonine-protein kinase [Capsicum annuum]|uniref:LOW QUALITY PROTEIN: senescence-induced receptor-like serine/threonine-protein kinase n=1 Tax=Capsicum annuum TaxID=4072 RepID=UPI001FB193B7|nr:LOW QUALITY PROTEIN: senescence-induced receptor-like serine/threonine-protein kinase [Capsicum annuum]
MTKDLIFAFLICISLFALDANAQIDQSGFISIDCGTPQGPNYMDAATGLHYVPDSGFMDTGVNGTISTEFQANGLEQQLFTLTSFPQGIRNCYTIRFSQGKGKKYLIRTRFLYGNYDGKSQPPNFDLHLGVDFWDTIKIDNASSPLLREIIHILSSDFVHVCLVNTGRGTPFISTLELRLLNSSMYETKSGSLQNVMRLDLGSTSSQLVRYQDDIYDRLWFPYNNVENTVPLSTSLPIDNTLEHGNAYRPPPKVLSTAIAGENGISFSWEPANATDEQYIYLHFAEIEADHVNRQFNIYVNGKLFDEPLAPDYLSSTTVFSTSPLTPRAKYQITLNKTGNSIRPPTINALEIYKVVRQFITSQTYDLDVEAIMNVKSTYGVKKNWQGDPCGSEDDTWNGVTCKYDVNPPRVISLNLSSSELHGTISPYITNLTKLESLDLSNNKLTGEVPAFLSHLAFLRVLDLKGNSFSGQMPEELLAKSRNRSLLLSYDEGGDKFGKKKKLSAGALASIVISVVVLGLLALIVLFWMIRKKNQQAGKITETERKPSPNIALELKSRQFTYSEVLPMTNNFQKVLGKGGFGTVYLGYVDNRDVAVKMLSPSSAQGFKEFRAEASLLMSIHHKNLISIVGYCVEGTHIGIIYEYMPNRSLDMQLSDKNPKPLTWEERLQIALDAAQGLEYLHHGCQPPIIHRDIKSSNILLDDKFQAKLADFGLSRILPTGEGGHVTTIIAGSPGYLDPEYYRSNKLTEKSDVYSFGVVLLEIVTGRHLLGKQDKIYVVTWVNDMLEKGDVSKVIDTRLQGEVDVKSSRKVVELAMACVSLDSRRRPDMSVIVSILKQCLREIIDYDSN